MIRAQGHHRFAGIAARHAPIPGLLLTFCLALPLCAAPALADEIGEAAGRLAAKLAFSNRGEVLSVEGDTLYLSLGQVDSIRKGSRFEVVHRGAPLRVGDEILGYEESPVGTAEALRVRNRVTVARMVESIQPPQKGDRVFQVKKGIGRVVVAQFRDGRGFNGLTENLQERLATALVNKGMQVVERSQLERMLREQKLGYSGLIELGSAMKIGQLLGAEGIVLGSVGDLGNTVTVSARLVDLEAGNSLTATVVSLAKTPLITRLREAGLEKSVSVVSTTIKTISNKSFANISTEHYIGEYEDQPEPSIVLKNALLTGVSGLKIIDNKWIFSNGFGKTTLLGTHPLTHYSPSLFKIKVGDNKLRYSVRSHDLGDSLIEFWAGDSLIHSEIISGKKWHEREVKLPSGTSEVVLKHYATGWHFEYLYWDILQ